MILVVSSSPIFSAPKCLAGAKADLLWQKLIFSSSQKFSLKNKFLREMRSSQSKITQNTRKQAAMITGSSKNRDIRNKCEYCRHYRHELQSNYVWHV
jgi:hypothetical protein